MMDSAEDLKFSVSPEELAEFDGELDDNTDSALDSAPVKPEEAISSSQNEKIQISEDCPAASNPSKLAVDNKYQPSSIDGMLNYLNSFIELVNILFSSPCSCG